MLITDIQWKSIREQFTSREKKQLNAVMAGECICPSGVFIDEGALHNDLRGKLLSALESKSRGNRA